MAGVATNLSGLAVLAAASVTAIPIVIRNSKARLFVLVFGAIFVFQSSSGLSPAKLAYLGVLLLSLGVAVPVGNSRLARTGFGVAVVLALLALLSAVRGNDPINVIRDASNYFLLIAAAPLAYHFGRRLSERTLMRFTVAAGLTGAYALTANWTKIRGLGGALPSAGASSNVLFMLGFSVVIARAFTSAKSGRWWALAAILMAAGLATGSRGMLFLVLAPITVAVWLRPLKAGSARRLARKALRSAVIVTPICFVVAIVAVSALSIDVGAAFDRILSVTHLGQGSANASLVERQLQQDLALSAFRQSPLVGSGPGTIWLKYHPTSNTYTASFNLDTSFVLLGKWGIVGSLAILILLWRWWRLLRPNRSVPDVWGLIVIGFVPVFLAQSALSSGVEDRGLPLTLILVGAGTIAHRRSSNSSALGVEETSTRSTSNGVNGPPARTH